jgi:hypothetical protein
MMTALCDVDGDGGEMRAVWCLVPCMTVATSQGGDSAECQMFR